MAASRKKAVARILFKKNLAKRAAASRNTTAYQQPTAPIDSGVGSVTRTPIAPSRAHPEAPPYRPYITG